VDIFFTIEVRRRTEPPQLEPWIPFLLCIQSVNSDRAIRLLLCDDSVTFQSFGKDSY
jgi:hypothetical protein